LLNHDDKERRHRGSNWDEWRRLHPGDSTAAPGPWRFGDLWLD
jgi:hypothetical protein